MRRSLSIILPTAAILCWWFVAFKNPIANEPLFINKNDESTVSGDTSLYYPAKLLSLDREAMQEALHGNSALMVKLIQQWDVDAEVIEAQGVENVKRLDRPSFLKSQLIGRMLLERSPEELALFQEKIRPRLIIDDMNQPIDLEQLPEKLFPQTFMAADMLLALTPPEKLVALPLSFRQQTPFYPDEETKEIPLDIGRYRSEKLYTSRPDIAFVSRSYSHPSTLNPLKQQGIILFHIGDVYTVEDIKAAIIKLGHIGNSPLKAELMTLFMDAALNAIDNKRAMMMPTINEKRVLGAFYHTQFSLPGTKTLTFHLMQRMGIDSLFLLYDDISCKESWTIPLYEEQIHHFNPEYFVIIAIANKDASDYFYSFPSLQHTDASVTGKIVVIDEAVQRTLSQHIVLAYYDLNAALVSLK